VTRIGVRLALGIIVACVPALVPLARAAASDRACGPSLPRGCLVVRTIPALPSVKLRLDGRGYLTDREGIARIPSPRSEELELTLATEQVERDGVRAKFSRWGDDVFTPSRTFVMPSSGNKEMELGFDIEYLVSLRYQDQDGAPVGSSKITSVEVGNSVGARFAIDPPTAAVWVPGARVIRTVEGLQLSEIPYSVRSVVVDGSNVVNEGQQVFQAEAHARWDVELLFYDAAITVEDRFFGFPTGATIDLTYPDGHTVQHKLNDGAVTVTGLPRGNYTIVVHGRGLKLRAPVAVSRDTTAKLVFLSYLDLGVALALGIAFAIGLITIGRRRLAREHRDLAEPSLGAAEPAEAVGARSEVT
jgi:hypothetical protein